MRSPLVTFAAFVTLLCIATPPLHAQTLSANAGVDQQGMFVGDTVNLNGSGSTGATSYAWTITKRPSGSVAALVNPLTATPSFVPDRGGQYTVRLTVGNGVTTAFDTVAITTANRAPTANAGLDIVSTVGKNVILNGTGSTDPDLNKLTYAWTLISHPDTSVSPLTKTTTSKPALLLDRPGTYVVQLVVKDGALFSAPDQVSISTANTAPVADAGPDRQVAVGALVQLNGTGSSDVDGNPIIFAWTLKRPSGSTAVLSDPAAPMPTFTADRTGTYTATLNVNDGSLTVKDLVIITTGNNRNPVARTKADDVALTAGQTIQLDAGDSTDANGGLLAYAWTITKRPSNSTNALVNPSTPRPTFTADKAGNYTFSLLVTDPGALTATDTQIDGTPLPQADAGADQTATIGLPVTLDGSRSSHLGANATIAYGWSLISVPAGSTAEFDDSTDPQPQFTPDLPGTYVAQLVLFDGIRLSKANTVTISTDGNLPPSVDLGADRKVTTGALVTVDALATDPDLDPLMFSWTLLSRPAGSAAVLSGAAGTPVHLTPDVAGDYIVQLTATDPGGLAAVDTLVITTGNTTPTVIAPADGGASASVPVPLIATAFDPDGGAITYLWSLIAKPSGSTAAISSPSAVSPTFTPDGDGVYVVQVIVRDNRHLYATDAAVFRVGGSGNPPVADAGTDQTVLPGAVVQLDGSGSHDPENQPLTYTWQLLSKPAGSVAALNNASVVNPHFTADLGGDYVVRLVVNDGGQNSAPSDVTITANAKPTANAGPDQIGVDLGVLVNLTGAASSDPESQPLTYAWSFTSKPAGSTATIASPTSATPSFTPDLAGIYIVQLIVNDGTSGSLADTVTVITRRVITLSPSSLSLSSGGSGQLTVTVSYSSASPLLLTLQSSNPSVATVPANVTIPANQLSANFNVTGGASNGGALVSASETDGAKASAAVAVGTRLVQWNVDASGAWETATNWTGNAIPGAGDVVVIDRPASNFVITLGSGTPAFASLLSRETLVVNGGLVVDGATAFEGPLTLTGSMSGTGAVTLNSAMTWTAGNFMMGGGLTVLPGRAIVFPNNNTGRALIGSSIVNHGTVSMGDTNGLTLQSPVSITNAADGVWTIVNGAIGSNGAGVLSFANAGIFRKTGVGGLTLNGFVPYTNTGTFDIQGGGLVLGDAATVTNNAVINVGATATVYLHQFTLGAGTTFTGAGSLNLNGNTTVTGDVTLTLPTVLTQSLTGSGTVHVAAPFTWISGNIVSLAGGLEVLAGRTLTFPNNNTGRGLIASNLVNHGTVDMGDTNGLTLQSPVSITNAAGALWTIANGAIGSNGAGVLSFTNAGTFRKTGTGGLTLNGFVPYTNTGTFDIQAGGFTLGDAATVTNSAVINVAATATVYLSQFTLAAGTTFTGAGSLNLNGNTTVTGDVTLTLPTILTQSLTGSGTVHVGAPFTWTSGNIVSLAGGFEVLAGRTLTFPNNNTARGLIASSLVNRGTFDMGDTNGFTLQAPVSITNAAGAVWTIVNGAIGSNGAGVLSFSNAGTFRKTGAGALTLNGFVPYTNTGTFDIQAGTMTFGDAATLVSSANIAVSAGAVINMHLVTLNAGSVVSGTGTLNMNGTTILNAVITVPTAVTLSQTLTGTGTLKMAAPMTWSGGVLALGGGLEILAGRTLALTGGIGLVTNTGTSVKNFGTVNWTSPGSFTYQGGSITIRNEVGGVWNLTAGGFSLAGNGNPNPLGSFTFVNAGTMQGAGNPATTLTVASNVTFSNTGAVNNMLVN